MFDEKIAKMAIGALKERGVEVSRGLTDKELDVIENKLDFRFPDDLRILLQEGVPVANVSETNFPNWHDDPIGILRKAMQGIENSFIFDIRENGYWHSLLGPKPADLKMAQEQAIKKLHELPPLIPICGHRYMPSRPSSQGNPILSVWQATDTVYYGYDLADYLQKEFDVELPLTKRQEPKPIPYWDKLFFDQLREE